VFHHVDNQCHIYQPVHMLDKDIRPLI
jgi:hypothetical protein